MNCSLVVLELMQMVVKLRQSYVKVMSSCNNASHRILELLKASFKKSMVNKKKNPFIV